MVRNAMPWVVHGQTAAEVISRRPDAARPHMALTNLLVGRALKEDVLESNHLSWSEGCYGRASHLNGAQAWWSKPP
jgi:hypothetical protein